jgi:hypothetical protein
MDHRTKNRVYDDGIYVLMPGIFVLIVRLCSYKSPLVSGLLEKRRLNHLEEEIYLSENVILNFHWIYL